MVSGAARRSIASWWMCDGYGSFWEREIAWIVVQMLGDLASWWTISRPRMPCLVGDNDCVSLVRFRCMEIRARNGR